MEPAKEPPDVRPHVPELRRDLSLLDSTMINVGSMIGSGIFLVPATIALYLHSTWLVILVWIIGGGVSLFGALSTAELGASYPKAGGQYVYLREAYGPVWGFLYGWTAFAVILTASISAVAVAFATYLGYIFPLSQLEIKIIAIVSIIILTTINCFGVKLGAIVQNTFTFLKLAAIVGLVLMSFWSGSGAIANLQNHPQTFLDVVRSMGLALVAVLWSYDGWIEITYVAGEVKHPQRNIPRSLILSTLLVILIYVVTNFTYIYVLSLDAISRAPMVTTEVANIVIGKGGATVTAIAVMVAMVGCNNGFVLTGARIYYAMASENIFFRSMANVHPKYRTPIAALIGQGIWACMLVLTGTFSQLFTYVVFASWIFYAMTAAAVIVLRIKSPELSRPYKTWGYPWTSVAFILFSLYLVFDTLIEDPRDSLIGLCIILLGLPAYLYWHKTSRDLT